MSSTNRGGKRSAADNYPTPAYCVHRLLEDPFAREHLPSGRWLEPGAGDGAIIRAASQIRSDIEWTALEIREECRPVLTDVVGPRGTVTIEDFLAPSFVSTVETPYRVVCGNPPFSLAQEFIERGMEVAEVVVLLLRTNYLSSARRCEFMRTYAPDTYNLPNRPSFRGQGTDSIEYAWFLWPKDRKRQTGLLRVLGSTPITERRTKKALRLEIDGKRERTERAKKVRVKLPPPKKIIDAVHSFSADVSSSDVSEPLPAVQGL